MADIHELFKESIAEFMENGLEAEPDEELGYRSTTTRIRKRTQQQNAADKLRGSTGIRATG